MTCSNASRSGLIRPVRCETKRCSKSAPRPNSSSTRGQCSALLFESSARVTLLGIRAISSGTPGYRPVGQPANDSRNSAGATPSSSSATKSAANVVASVRPVSKARTAGECSHLRQTSAGVQRSATQPMHGRDAAQLDEHAADIEDNDSDRLAHTTTLTSLPPGGTITLRTGLPSIHFWTVGIGQRRGADLVVVRARTDFHASRAACRSPARRSRRCPAPAPADRAAATRWSISAIRVTQLPPQHVADMRHDRREHLHDQLDRLVTTARPCARGIVELRERVHQLHDRGDRRVEHAPAAESSRHLRPASRAPCGALRAARGRQRDELWARRPLATRPLLHDAPTPCATAGAGSAPRLRRRRPTTRACPPAAP